MQTPCAIFSAFESCSNWTRAARDSMAPSCGFFWQCPQLYARRLFMHWRCSRRSYHQV